MGVNIEDMNDIPILGEDDHGVNTFYRCPVCGSVFISARDMYDHICQENDDDVLGR